MSNPLDHETSLNNTISLQDLFEALRTQKKLIFITIFSFISSATIIAYMITPVYTLDVIFEISPVIQSQASKGSSLLSSLPGNLFGGLGGGGRQSALAVLRARSSVVSFIDDNELLPVLFSENWDSEKEIWIDETEKPTLWDGYHRFIETVIDIDDSIDTGIITLTIEWKDREVAAKWANDYLKAVDDLLRRNNLDESQERLVYLEAQLRRSQISSLNTAITDLIKTEMHTIMLSKSSNNFIFKTIDEPMMPNEGDFTKPKKLLIIIFGALIGAFVSIVAAFLRHNDDKS